MSLHSHISALDEVANRARGVRGQLNSCLEGLIGPMPQDPAGRAEAPVRSGINGELQDRIEGLFNLMGQLEALTAMIADQCVDTRNNIKGDAMGRFDIGTTAAGRGF